MRHRCGHLFHGSAQAHQASLTDLARYRPDDLFEAWQDTLSRGPGWRARIDASLKRMSQTADTLAGMG
jgi:hypothetical protein